LIKRFECPKDAPPCYLAKGHEKLLGPNEYWMSLDLAGIRDGDQLELVGRPSRTNALGETGRTLGAFLVYTTHRAAKGSLSKLIV
jgi:hypothetical protein